SGRATLSSRIGACDSWGDNKLPRPPGVLNQKQSFIREPNGVLEALLPACSESAAMLPSFSSPGPALACRTATRAVYGRLGVGPVKLHEEGCFRLADRRLGNITVSGLEQPRERRSVHGEFRRAAARPRAFLLPGPAVDPRKREGPALL